MHAELHPRRADESLPPDSLHLRTTAHTLPADSNTCKRVKEHWKATEKDWVSFVSMFSSICVSLFCVYFFFRATLKTVSITLQRLCPSVKKCNLCQRELELSHFFNAFTLKAVTSARIKFPLQHKVFGKRIYTETAAQLGLCLLFPAGCEQRVANLCSLEERNFLWCHQRLPRMHLPNVLNLSEG